MSPAKDYAYRLLGLRRMTEYEVRQKLKLRKYPDEEIDKAVSACMYYGYLDDADYAICYVKDAYHLKEWGRSRIAAELRKKGVSSDLIDTAFREADVDEQEVLVRLIERKFSDVSQMEWKEKQKVFAALARRGFSASLIQKTVNEEVNFEEYDE